MKNGIIQIYFYATTITISAFVGAMASTVWNELIVGKKGIKKFILLLLYYLLFLLAIFLIIFAIVKIGNL